MKTTQDLIIEGIEARCKALGREPVSLCVDAGLSPNTWKNWTEGGVSPTLTKIELVLAQIRFAERRTRSTAVA